MPCRSGMTPSPNEAIEAHTKKVRGELDEVTQLLCGLCSSIESKLPMEQRRQLLVKDSKLTNWWNKHKEFDLKRRQKEQEQARKKVKNLQEEIKKTLRDAGLDDA